MIRLFRKKGIRGFTLIELLVVIAIIALLAAILTPAVNNALLKGRITQVVNNGRNIFTLLFAKELDNPLGLQSASSTDWPDDGDFTDSSEYFATLVTNASLNLTYDLFAAPGVAPATDEQEFTDGTELRNVWCITEDVSDRMKATVPVLFTQNISMNGTDITTFDSLEEDARPFGDRGAVIVNRGGSAFSLNEDTALATNFNPTTANNSFLWPVGNTQFTDTP